jgi:hypothetical protein
VPSAASCQRSRDERHRRRPRAAIDLQAVIASMDRDLAESAKLRQEANKLEWERLKLERERLKLDAETAKPGSEARKYRFDPLLVIAGAIIARLFLREDKANAEVGCRFYALCDKISRADILAPAYAQCRSDEGARYPTPKIGG